MMRSKRYRSAKEKMTLGKRYQPDEAFAKLKELPAPKFTQTVEAVFTLSLKESQTVRDSLQFPHPFGKPARVIVFGNGEKIKEAEDAGAVKAGEADLIEEVKKGWLDFDVAIATPDIMKDVARL